jgi:RimJ/RimL family protein N-acetyltransferase
MHPSTQLAEGFMRGYGLDLRLAQPGEIRVVAVAAGATATDRLDALEADHLGWWKAHGYGVWIIANPGDGSILGWCGLRPNGTPSEPELMYVTIPSARGRGVASGAAQRIITFAFSGPHIRSIWAATAPSNLPSRKVMERAGMSFERHGQVHGLESMIYRIHRSDAPE